MNYSAAPGSNEMFTDAFVQPWALQGICQLREVAREVHVHDRRTRFGKPSSINQRGRYQTGLVGMAVEVKDSTRNSDRHQGI